MVTYMPIYTWVKGGKTSDCSPFKRRALCSTDKSLTEDRFTCSASSQWKQSWAPGRLLSVCHGPLNQWRLTTLPPKAAHYPCMSQSWQRGTIPAFTSSVRWMPSLRVELCCLTQRTSTNIPPSAPQHIFTAESSGLRHTYSVLSPALLYFATKEGATSPALLALHYFCNCVIVFWLLTQKGFSFQKHPSHVKQALIQPQGHQWKARTNQIGHNLEQARKKF